MYPTVFALYSAIHVVDALNADNHNSNKQDHGSAIALRHISTMKAISTIKKCTNNRKRLNNAISRQKYYLLPLNIRKCCHKKTDEVNND